MTRERYESISLHDLREIAKNRGMRRISALKKAELIDAMLEKDAEEARILHEEKLQRRKTQENEGREETDRGPDGQNAAAGKGQAAGADAAGRTPEGGKQETSRGDQGDLSAQRKDGPADMDKADRAGADPQASGKAAAEAAGERQPEDSEERSGQGREVSRNPRQQRQGTDQRGQGQRGRQNPPVYAGNGRRQAGVRQRRDDRQGQQPGRQTRQPRPAGGQGPERGRYRDQAPQDRPYDAEAGQDRDPVRETGSAVRTDLPAGNTGAQASGYRDLAPGGMDPVAREAQGTYRAAQPSRPGDGGRDYSRPDPGRPDAGRGPESLQEEGMTAGQAGRTEGQAGAYAGGQEERQEPAGQRLSRVYQPGRPDTPVYHKDELNTELDSGQLANGILEVMQDGFGFIRCANYMPGENDIYVAPSQIRRFGLKTGDIIVGNIRVRTQGEKFSALLYVKSVNGFSPDEATRRFNFEDMTPIFPDERIRLERPGGSLAMRVMDLMSPVGKGQRGMIVSPPKAGKTTLIKDVARSVIYNNPEIHLIVLLIDERPEEVTDIREAIEGPNAEVIYSTFDELPEHHKRVSEMAIERARRLVEHKKDVMILLDSITRLTRAYNITEPPSGRTLSGGLDPAALHMPKRFFGAARNMREGGSLTILATALIDTGSKMDDIVFEEFKGTGNMEIVLDRCLSERRIFPAIDIVRSGTRRDDLLLTPDELNAINMIRRAFNGLSAEQAVTQALDLFARTRTNGEFVNMVRKIQWGDTAR